MDLKVTLTGSFSPADQRAGLRIVTMENQRRAENLDEEGELIEPLLPVANPGQIRQSYEIMLDKILASAHADYIRQADEADYRAIEAGWKNASDEQRQAAKQALTGS